MLMTPELTLIDFYISKNATIRPGVSHAIKHQKVHSISYEVFWQKEREGGRKKEREKKKEGRRGEGGREEARKEGRNLRKEKKVGKKEKI